MKSLILASTSPYRREQLQRLSLPFESIPPHCDEDSYKSKNYSISKLAQVLAKEKAMSLQAEHSTSIIIGGDQIAAIDDKILSKPLKRDKACEQLRELSGKTHQLYTAIALVNGENIYEHLEVANLTMVNLTNEQIENYVEKDLPLYSCGSYKIESFGISLFEKIEVQDFTSIVGIPMLFVAKKLRELGYLFP